MACPRGFLHRIRCWRNRARVHVVVPPGFTSHPWDESSLDAVEMLKGYGLTRALLGANGLLGTAGTGP